MSIVTESHWGPNPLGSLIIIFFVSTLVLARSFDFIIEKWDRLVKITRKKVGLPPNQLYIDSLWNEAEDEMEREKANTDTGFDEEEGSSTLIRRKWPMTFVKNLRARKKGKRRTSIDKNLP
ncbi:hypothetical protein IFR04_011029 [Cadophora malorum]|uniref:Uncharacterized protein n=1 Tax=Cadophora malorum TaxID=108018 RepID=A0A8H7T642_9HELO|nr:hypothetical protein IFR04_011029 [Cadophora malorum]